MRTNKISFRRISAMLAWFRLSVAKAGTTDYTE
jgi:hypothetical protein